METNGEGSVRFGRIILVLRSEIAATRLVQHEQIARGRWAIVSYSEQVRHPSGALNRPRVKGASRRLWFWLLGLAAVFVYLIWRAGLRSANSHASATGPVGNSNGWV